jgi:hypothetical protein
MGALIGIVSLAVAALLTYWLELRRDRAAALRNERISAATDFCLHLMEYSGVQLTERRRDLKNEPHDEELKERIRGHRAKAWAAYFRVVLVVDDTEAEQLARSGLDAVNALGMGPPPADDDEALKTEGQGVRELAERFMRRVAITLDVETSTLKGDATEE